MRAAAALGVGQLRVNVPPYDPAEIFARSGQRRSGTLVAELRQARCTRPGRDSITRLRCRAACGGVLVDGSSRRRVALSTMRKHGVRGLVGIPARPRGAREHLAHVHLKSGRWERTGKRPTGTPTGPAYRPPLRDGVVDVPALSWRCTRSATTAGDVRGISDRAAARVTDTGQPQLR